MIVVPVWTRDKLRAKPQWGVSLGTQVWVGVSPGTQWA